MNVLKYFSMKIKKNITGILARTKMAQKKTIFSLHQKKVVVKKKIRGHGRARNI